MDRDSGLLLATGLAAGNRAAARLHPALHRAPRPVAIAALLDPCAALPLPCPCPFASPILFPPQVEMADLQSGIAAAQEAHVFVGVHGGELGVRVRVPPGGSGRCLFSASWP